MNDHENIESEGSKFPWMSFPIGKIINVIKRGGAKIRCWITSADEDGLQIKHLDGRPDSIDGEDILDYEE